MPRLWLEVRTTIVIIPIINKKIVASTAIGPKRSNHWGRARLPLGVATTTGGATVINDGALPRAEGVVVSTRSGGCNVGTP